MALIQHWSVVADANIVVWDAKTTSLVVADATHAHSAENPSLGIGVLVINDAIHEHSTDEVSLTTQLQAQWDVVPIGNVFVWPTSSGLTFAVDDATHAHSADNAQPMGTELTSLDAEHSHDADNVLLGTFTGDLFVADILHSHGANTFSLQVLGGLGPYIPPSFDVFIDSPTIERCWLLELEAFPLAAAPTGSEPSGGYGGAAYSEVSFSEGVNVGVEQTIQTLYYSDQGYISTIYTGGVAGGDPASRIWYDGRLGKDIRVERRIFGRESIGGLSRVFAEVVLVNSDGGLDSLTHDYSLHGRAARLYVGHPKWNRGRFELIASGVVDRIWSPPNAMRVSLSDGLARLDRNINLTTYAGTGTGASVEGSSDFKNKYKPKAYGPSFNISPPLVDSTLLIYQFHDGAAQDATAVYDRGISLTKGSPYASLDDLVTNAPAGGQYRTWQSGGMFRLGATPAGTVTADVEGETSAGYIVKAGELVQHILETQAEFDLVDIDRTSFDQLNIDAPASVGVWIGAEGETISDVIDELLSGIGAFGGFSRQGTFTVGLIYAPGAGVTVDKFTEEDIYSVERLPLPSEIEPICWRVRVGWQKNHTRQNDFASTVSPARRTFAAEPIRYAIAEDTAIQSRHRLAREFVSNAIYSNQSDAEAEAARLLDLWGKERRIFRVMVTLRAMQRDLGEVITLQHPRHGWSSGVAARILGHALSESKVELTVLV